MTDLDKSVHEALQSTAELSLRAGADIGAQDAAAEIARLRKVNERLVDALNIGGRNLLSGDEIDKWQTFLQEMGRVEYTPAGCNVLCWMAKRYLEAIYALAEAGQGEG